MTQNTVTVDLAEFDKEIQEAQVDVFQTGMMSCKFVFSNGKVANFVGGKYYTDLDNEIAELNREISAGNPNIAYFGKMAKADINPANALKRAAIREFLEEQRRKVGRDMGTSVQGPLIASAANTDSLAEVIGQEKVVSSEQKSADAEPTTEGSGVRLAALRLRGAVATTAESK